MKNENDRKFFVEQVVDVLKQDMDDNTWSEKVKEVSLKISTYLKE
jgi:hypothetical protein